MKLRAKILVFAKKANITSKDSCGDLRSERVPHSVLDFARHSRGSFCVCGILDTDSFFSIHRLSWNKIPCYKRIFFPPRDENALMTMFLNDCLASTFHSSSSSSSSTTSPSTSSTASSSSCSTTSSTASHS